MRMMFGLRSFGTPAGTSPGACSPPPPAARVRPALLFGVRTLRWAWTRLPPTVRTRHTLTRVANDDVDVRVFVDGSRMLCVCVRPYRCNAHSHTHTFTTKCTTHGYVCCDARTMSDELLNARKRGVPIKKPDTATAGFHCTMLEIIC